MSAMNSDRSVIVDPVLCYLSNHRRTVSDQYLCTVISRHFPAPRIAEAFDLLRGQTANLLAVSNDKDAEEITNCGNGNVESILRIFRLCDQYGINLPEFAVVDLSSLPPPPSSRHHDGPVRDEQPENEDGAISFTSRLTTSPSFSIHGHFSPDMTPNDALFTHQMLARIVQELKQLKSLVIDFSQARKPQPIGVNVGVNVGPEDDTEEYRRTSDTTGQGELEERNEDRPDSAMVVDTCNSPLERASPNEEHKPPSRGSTASATRTVMTPPRKRGSSRSSSSIEDAVAKIKAQIHSGVGLLSIGTPSVEAEADDAEPTSPEVLSPKMEPADLTIQSPNTIQRDYPENRNMSGDSLISSLLAAAGAPSVDRVIPNASMVSRLSSLYPTAPSSILTDVGRHPGLLGMQFPALAQLYQQPTGNAGSSVPPPCDQQMATADTPGKQMDCVESDQPSGTKVKKKLVKRQSSTSDSPGGSLTTKKTRHDKTDADCAGAETESGDGGSDDKPFKCTHDNCNKGFANKFLLKKHEFIHTGLRPYQCPYCFQRCNRKDNLLRHKLTHEKNFGKSRRRSCRVFGVKRDPSGPHSDVVTGSAAFSPSASSVKDCVPERSASCAPTEHESTTAIASATAPAPHHQSPPAPTLFQHSAAISPEGNFPLAVWASYMAQSLWSASNLGGANSLNN